MKLPSISCPLAVRYLRFPAALNVRALGHDMHGARSGWAPILICQRCCSTMPLNGSSGSSGAPGACAFPFDARPSGLNCTLLLAQVSSFEKVVEGAALPARIKEAWV